ncbi:MAG: LysM peptidoglycan-binding domain-containing protein [Pseudobdellovibrionaceae bacterium]
MMSGKFGLIAVIVSVWALSTQAKVVKHVVLEDETAWFIAQVYYGNGTQFTKLLSANKLSRPEDMKEGMEILIEDPKFSQEQNQFAERYTKLWAARQKALGLTTGESLPSSKVVIPTQKILNQDNTPKLPFTEVRDPAQSTADLANHELHKGTRSSEVHEKE